MSNLINKARKVEGAYCDGLNWQRGSAISGVAADLVRDLHDRPVRWLYDSRRAAYGTSAFLVGRGWSATPERLKALEDSNVMTMAVNEYPATFTPKAWLIGDPPRYFPRRIWDNPNVMKFSPYIYRGDYLPGCDANQHKRPWESPNSLFYHHSVNNDRGDFFHTPYATWGTLGEFGKKMMPKGGVRSCMIAALRMLWHLGARHVYLIGSDFTPWEHPDNDYFNELSGQLRRFRPVFDEYGFKVKNANPDSHLRAFDVMDFNAALEEAKAHALERSP